MLSSEKKEYRMKSRFFKLLKQKELDEGRDISDQEIMDATNLARNTIKAWKSEEPISRIHVHSAMLLAKYMECEWHELVEPAEI